VVATFVEIVTHAILATLFVGWNYGFEIILICMIPLPYMFMPKRKIYMHLLSLWTIALFIALRICCVDVGLRISENVTDEPSSLWYIFNCSLSFTVILMLTFIFRSRTDNLNQSLSEQNVRLKKVASVDSLTGLLNRRAMSGYLEQIAMTADYYSVALLDIDFFKRVNDTYGHAAGDEVLLKVSQLLLKNVPTEGYICRWGGEEILIVLPGFTIGQSREIAEDLRKKISEIRFESGGTEFGITVTIGVYECKNTDSETVDTAIRIADDRLYSGKNSGRNRVVSD
jgi:diguanylate cyclase (GGDEF)-like protein